MSRDTVSQTDIKGGQNQRSLVRNLLSHGWG